MNPSMPSITIDMNGQWMLVLLWDRELLTNKQKIITAHASSAYKHALREVLQAQGIASQIKVVGYLSLS